MMPWELEADLSSARQETWLLSFIDILALLLTLFVLLLAHQDSRPKQAAQLAVGTSASFDFSLFSLTPTADTPSLAAVDPGGFAVPGEGLLPLPVDKGSDRSGSSNEVAPEATAPEATAPEATAPEATAPEATAPEAIAPEAVAPDQAPAPADPASDDLLETFKDTELGEQVEVTVRPGVVSLEISDSILFTPASAALSTDGLRCWIGSRRSCARYRTASLWKDTQTVSPFARRATPRTGSCLRRARRWSRAS
jgi:flagellar motor protein MotB